MMMSKLRWLWTYINFFRVLPAYLCMRINRFHVKCENDLDAWIKYEPCVIGHLRFWQFSYLLINYKECRNIFLNRLHRNPLMFIVVRVLFSPLESCYINMPPEKLGGGFSLQHGFSTIIAAEEIGEDCRIYQQVTVGFRGEGKPIIGDDVKIAAGAIVIGNILINNGARIGAGAVVIHNVSPNTTVVGVPARVIKKEDI